MKWNKTEVLIYQTQRDERGSDVCVDCTTPVVFIEYDDWYVFFFVLLVVRHFHVALTRFMWLMLCIQSIETSDSVVDGQPVEAQVLCNILTLVLNGYFNPTSRHGSVYNISTISKHRSEVFKYSARVLFHFCRSVFILFSFPLHSFSIGLSRKVYSS